MRKIQASAVAVGLLLAVHTVMAVKVNVDFDKAFAFKEVRSWDWNPTSRGDVMMARTPDDKPESFKQLAEPIILSAVAGFGLFTRYFEEVPFPRRVLDRLGNVARPLGERRTSGAGGRA